MQITPIIRFLTAMLLVIAAPAGLWAIPAGSAAPQPLIEVQPSGPLVSDEVGRRTCSELGLPPPRRVLPYPPRPILV